ncbi:MAG: hypothetical protein QXU20_01465 [Candidatus Woesearchaeota archaeon]
MKKEVDKDKILRDHTIRVLERFLMRLNANNVEDSNIQLFHIIKNYFASKYNIRYSFTYEELEEELKNRKTDEIEKKRIIEFLKKAEEYEYKKFPNKKVEYERIKKLAKEFKNYILKAGFKEKEEGEKTKTKIFLFPILTKKSKRVKEKKEISVPKKEKINKKTKTESAPREGLERIYELLLEGNELLNTNLEEAKERYRKIKEIYERLSIEEKKTVRDEIIDFYNKIIGNMNS